MCRRSKSPSSSSLDDDDDSVNMGELNMKKVKKKEKVSRRSTSLPPVAPQTEEDAEEQKQRKRKSFERKAARSMSPFRRKGSSSVPNQIAVSESEPEQDDDSEKVKSPQRKKVASPYSRKKSSLKLDTVPPHLELDADDNSSRRHRRSKSEDTKKKSSRRRTDSLARDERSSKPRKRKSRERKKTSSSDQASTSTGDSSDKIFPEEKDRGSRRKSRSVSLSTGTSTPGSPRQRSSSKSRKKKSKNEDDQGNHSRHRRSVSLSFASGEQQAEQDIASRSRERAERREEKIQRMSQKIALRERSPHEPCSMQQQKGQVGGLIRDEPPLQPERDYRPALVKTVRFEESCSEFYESDDDWSCGEDDGANQELLWWCDWEIEHRCQLDTEIAIILEEPYNDLLCRAFNSCRKNNDDDRNTSSEEESSGSESVEDEDCIDLPLKSLDTLSMARGLEAELCPAITDRQEQHARAILDAQETLRDSCNTFTMQRVLRQQSLKHSRISKLYALRMAEYDSIAAVGAVRFTYDDSDDDY